MAELTIFWTLTAIKQRNLIFDYWNKTNGNQLFSKELRNQISDRISQLVRFPKLGKEADFASTRTISLGHYSIFYQLINTQIIITAFWDNRQDPEELKNFLK